MIVLTGFMGSGKSTVGARLAERLGTSFLDTDRAVETQTGSGIGALFDERGEEGFRKVEAAAVLRALEDGPGIVALGGGALTTPEVAAALIRTDALVIHLDVPFDVAIERVGPDPGRPLLAGDARGLFESREAGYRSAATFSVDSGSNDVDAIVERIVALSRLGRVDLVTSSGCSPMVIGEDILWSLASIPVLGSAEKLFVVTHPSLAAYADRVVAAAGDGLPATIVTVPEGEVSKSAGEAARLHGILARANAHRHDVVAGVGGGVITDLAGYVASTYNRGMPVVHVPTSLLGMVDAAIGGKTAIDLPEGKNLVGTFHQPAGVLADISVLGSLPEGERRAGLAEVIKYGFIADPGILDLVTGGPETAVEMVRRSAAIKASIVANDEYDRGGREVLNYGHTFAHAIETARGFGGIRHGEAVAIGMMAAAHLAHIMGRIDADLVDEHRRILDAAGLPVTAQIAREDLEASWKRDKKYRGGVRFVLLRRAGVAEPGVRAEAEEIDEALERLAR